MPCMMCLAEKRKRKKERKNETDEGKEIMRQRKVKIMRQRKAMSILVGHSKPDNV